MPQDRKYKTKGSNYKPGNVTNIVKEIAQGNKDWDEGMRFRTAYLKGTKLTAGRAERVKKIKEEILK